MLEYYSSEIELSKSAIENNVRFMKGLVGKGVRISSVVKANAYGHGLEYFAPLVEKQGIDHFSVFGSDEARCLKSVLSDSSDIMIMGWVSDNDMEWVISNEIEFFVFEPNTLLKALLHVRRLGKKAKVHIELETGMNRTGLKGPALTKIINTLKENENVIDIMGICTHFAGAESIANYHRIKSQIKNFESMVLFLKDVGIHPKILHTSCSAATIAYPDTCYDMVRIGMLQYGFWPSKEIYVQYLSNQKYKTDPLKRVISWKSKVMSVKHVPRGEFVSYGTTFFAEDDKQIAVIPVGYSSGFSRGLSNQGRIIIKGKRVGVIGLVNMNMLIADITKLKGVHIGDEVILIGRQGNSQVTVSAFGELSSQLNYELLTRLPYNLKRIITN